MQATVAGGVWPLTRLNDTNYLAWSFKMQMLLKRDGLWTCIENPDALEAALDDDEREEMNQRALSTIVLHLEDSQLSHVRGVQSARRCWDTLRAAHVRESACSRMLLTRKLYRAQLREDGSVQEHLQFIRQTFMELEEAGVQFTESHKAYVLLSSLNKSWDSFTLSFEALKEADLTMEYLSGRLLEEERRRLDNKQDETRSRLEQSRLNSGEGSGEEKVFFARRCHVCNSPSHLMKDCPRKSSSYQRGRGRRFRRGTFQSTSHFVTGAESFCTSWVLDSGATDHISSNPELFELLQPSSRQFVCLANGQRSLITGEGVVNFPGLGKLENVLCVPSLQNNLISVGCLTARGYTVVFDKDGSVIKKADIICARADKVGKLYQFKEVSAQSETNLAHGNVPAHNDCIHVAHRKLAHINFRKLQSMKHHVEGLKIRDCNLFLDCSICKSTKSKAYPVSKQSNRQTTKAFELVHVDILGPISTQSIGGASFALILVDDFTRFSFCYLLKNKAETFDAFKQWLLFVENRFSAKVSILQSDCGAEFLSHRFTDLLKSKGISHQKSNVYVHAENGIAERKIGVLKQMVSALLEDSGLSQSFWGEAIQTANYILNRTVSSVVKETPYFLLHHKKPYLGHLRLFGSSAWVNIPQEIRRKNEPKAKKMIFVGYQTGTKGYRFFDSGKRIIVSRSASFAEHSNWKTIHANAEILVPFSNAQKILKDKKSQVAQDILPNKQETQQNGNVENSSQGESGVEIKQESEPQLRRSERSTKGIPPQRFIIENVSCCSVFDNHMYKFDT